MNVSQYKRLIQEFPEYETCLKKHVVRSYLDHKVKFIINAIKRVEYFDSLPADVLFDLIFSLKQELFDKETIILAEDHVVDSIFFIEEGTIEVSSEFENNKFVIDRLGPGSAINYRSIFLKDQMYLSLVATTDVKMLVLPIDTLMGLVAKYGET